MDLYQELSEKMHLSSAKPRKVYTVSALNRYVNTLLKSDTVTSGLWLSGEVSNFKHHSSGHLYFSLKDDTASIDCVMFASRARMLRADPRDGDEVLVYGRTALYEARGSYQFYVDSLEAAGNGRLYEQFEKLKKQLEAEGLFDPAHKQKVPAYPRTVGIVTSPTGAAIQDITRISKRRNPGIRLVLYPALVQGAEASPTIVKGIKTLDARDDIDVIIVGRGGGSLEDLWPFNEEAVARAIYAAKKPIISGVGHETDTTISDYVADVRASTPSAAAELAVPDVSVTFMELDSLQTRRYQAVRKKSENLKERLRYLGEKLENQSPSRHVLNMHHQLEMLHTRTLAAMENKVLQTKNRAGLLFQKLELLSPRAALEKGYALVSDEGGHVVSSVSQTSLDQSLLVTVKDGTLRTVVKERKEETHGGTQESTECKAAGRTGRKTALPSGRDHEEDGRGQPAAGRHDEAV